jgi:hypothetical protein
MEKMKNLLTVALLALSMGLASCDNVVSVFDKPVEPEITLEDALKDGTIVVLTFNVNGEDFYVAFVRVGDTYELLDYDKALTRADEPTITEQDCDFKMEHDKANNVIKFTVTEKKTSDLVMTAIIDIKASTIEIIPGNSKIKVTGVKMKVSNVEITSLLKEKGEGVTLADALVKGAKVEITYKWSENRNPTVFTFVNEGGKFSCKITGHEADNFEGSSLKLEGNLLIFSADNWSDIDCSLRIDFNTATDTFKFMTIRHDYYNSHTISVNGTDITKSLKKVPL